MRLLPIAAVILLGLLVTGCGGSGEGMSVKGKVSLDGQAVDAGSIVFLPSGGAGSKASAAIEQGQYTVPPEEGLKPGTYRVELSWFKPTGRKIESSDPGIMMDETREAFPAKFNTHSTLTAEITSGENVKDFELSSK